jgi:nucleotide-binding universal stress UspA family protein
MKFLVAYTGSRESRAALELAGRIARATEAVVVVMTSMEGGSGETADDVGKAEYELNAARRLLQDQGVACEVQSFARGLSPGEDVVKFIDEHGIGHVFIGIEKKSRTRKLFMGSTAQYIILKASCPVTCVK